MSSQISIKVGNVTATLPVGANITDAKVAAALNRYATSLGIPITGDAQTDLTAILTSFIDEIKRRSNKAQVDAAQATNLVTAQATADADNAL